MSALNKKLLLFGSIQTLAMAIYHFCIPFQFQWSQFLSDDIPTINWALYGLNNYFSFNLLVVSVFLLYHLKCKVDKLYTIKILTLIILSFWVFSIVYQLVKPMPLPESLQWLGIILPTIAFINIIIFCIPLKRLFQPDKIICLLLLAGIFSCGVKETNEPKSYIVSFNIEAPKKGELIVFVPDSLKRKRDKWKPYYYVGSTGIIKVSGKIKGPGFFYFQLGKTPILNKRIIFPENTVKINIKKDSLTIKSNPNQTKLAYFNNNFNSFSETERIQFIKKSLKESLVLLKALGNWKYYHEITPEILESTKYHNTAHSNFQVTGLINKLLDKVQRFNLNQLVPNFSHKTAQRDLISLKDFKAKYIFNRFLG